ncbi:NADAR family protein [Chryseolinea sp. T2]|uniref:NADAR family protein n=1 Tax=Chryseolinea sp. T2 TaxID=3129255 RepID=UPI0030781E5D
MKYDLAWLKRKYDGGDRPEFVFFGDESASNETPGVATLTQWFPSPFRVDSDQYHNAAHWMMVQKARLFNDPQAASELLSLSDNKEIGERGKQISGFDQKHWDDHRYNIVLQGNLHKFSQHQTLHAYISGTYPMVLTEANPKDSIWGIGMPAGAPGITDPYQWKGLNLLGFALMEVRDILAGIVEAASSAL